MHCGGIQVVSLLFAQVIWFTMPYINSSSALRLLIVYGPIRLWLALFIFSLWLFFNFDRHSPLLQPDLLLLLLICDQSWILVGYLALTLFPCLSLQTFYSKWHLDWALVAPLSLQLRFKNTLVNSVISLASLCFHCQCSPLLLLMH